MRRSSGRPAFRHSAGANQASDASNAAAASAPARRIVRPRSGRGRAVSSDTGGVVLGTGGAVSGTGGAASDGRSTRLTGAMKR